MADDTPTRRESWLMRMGTAGELLAMLSRSGRWWLLPLTVLLLLLAVVLIGLQAAEYVAPFIYLMF